MTTRMTSSSVADGLLRVAPEGESAALTHGLRPASARSWRGACCIALAAFVVCGWIEAQDEPDGSAASPGDYDRWVQTSGPAEGAISQIAYSPSDPNIVYAGTSGGVYRSDDGGHHWRATRLRNLIVSALVVHPNRPDVVWVAAGPLNDQLSEPCGLYKTEDGGATWKQTIRYRYIRALAVDPGHP
ncbi:MAG: hypothetical protein Q7T59_02855, partial [Candidatus Woesebacteria bacterium]|nr:hypothetical protein [Candidatus Woesebacteria bacterium]